MHVCVQSWETGPGEVFRPHLEKNSNTEVLRLKPVISHGFQNKSLLRRRLRGKSVQKIPAKKKVYLCEDMKDICGRLSINDWKYP